MRTTLGECVMHAIGRSEASAALRSNVEAAISALISEAWELTITSQGKLCQPEPWAPNWRVGSFHFGLRWDGWYIGVIEARGDFNYGILRVYTNVPVPELQARNTGSHLSERWREDLERLQAGKGARMHAVPLDAVQFLISSIRALDAGRFELRYKPIFRQSTSVS